MTSRYVALAEGIPNDPKVIAAIDAWANVWGNESVPTGVTANSLDETIPEQNEVLKKLAKCADNLNEVLPNVRVFAETLLFDGGHVRLGI